MNKTINIKALYASDQEIIDALEGVIKRLKTGIVEDRLTYTLNVRVDEKIVGEIEVARLEGGVVEKDMEGEKQ